MGTLTLKQLLERSKHANRSEFETELSYLLSDMEIEYDSDVEFDDVYVDFYIPEVELCVVFDNRLIGEKATEERREYIIDELGLRYLHLDPLDRYSVSVAKVAIQIVLARKGL